MTKLLFSSGDLTADRRADYARMLLEAGDAVAAADLMRQALELVPGWAAGWFSLGTCEEKAGRLAEAADAYRAVLRLASDDVYGAQMKLAALGQADVPEQPPASYVERLFDDYAARFDAALVDGLGYSIPEKLAAMIFAHAPDGFASAIDLGCGTGLLGERLRQRVSYLKGYDLSRGMLAKAEEKGIYDQLGQADLALPLGQGGLPLPDPQLPRADLVTAADVLMYFGNLEPVFETAAAIAAPGALFAFSVEEGAIDTDWQLQPSLRYRHGEPYLRLLCQRFGFEVVVMERSPIRRDGDKTITGLLTLARRMPASDAAVTCVPGETAATERPVLQ